MAVFEDMENQLHRQGKEITALREQLTSARLEGAVELVRQIGWATGHAQDFAELVKECILNVAEMERRKEGWTDEAREAVFDLEERFDIELVSCDHHESWVNRCERLEEQVAELEKELETEYARAETAEGHRALLYVVAEAAKKIETDYWATGDVLDGVVRVHEPIKAATDGGAM